MNKQERSYLLKFANDGNHQEDSWVDYCREMRVPEWIEESWSNYGIKDWNDAYAYFYA